MAQRRLTRRQARHVQRIQEKRRARAARRETEAGDQGQLGAEETGLIIANYGQHLLVEGDDGTRLPCLARANLELPVCGDRVVWQRAGKEGGVVAAVMPRETTLERPDATGRLKPLAANIDWLVVVAAARPQPDTGLIDRYLAAAELAGIRPLLVLNKIDLVADTDRPALDACLAPYPAIGYPLIRVSTRTAHGLDPLLTALQGHTSILVGQSGVGKSSLVKALLPDLEIRVGALSAASGLGRHTTSTATLYRLPTGGNLIDSPGVREFSLHERDPARLARGFIEFRPWLGACRFRDCRHRREPGCALRRAVAAGDISEARLASYLQVADEMEAATR